MTRDEYRAWIRQYAPTIGLDPNLAESVWQQESSGSLDTTMKGPELSRGRGNAIGPWQVVPAYHPEFPVGGDPVEQGKYAMSYLKEVGPARYYGTGQAPPGQPSTDQYVSQVMRRAGRQDVRMAANTTGSTDTDRTPSGDPVTGRMIPMLPPFTMATPTPEAPAETDWLSPLVALIGGAAIGGGRGLGRAVQLAGGGMASAQTAENELLELKQKRADAARRRQGQDALDRYADQLSQNPETAEIGAMMRVDPASGMRYYAETRKAQMEQQARQSYAQQLKDAGATDYQVAQAMAGQNPGQQDKPAGPAQYGLAPKQYVAADGKTVMERVYASDGSFVDRVLPGAPIAYDPETAANVAAGRAKGTAQGGADESTRQGLVTLGTLYDEIVKTLPEATGSGLGALADQAAAFFGQSTKGAEAAQKLQVLGARLVGTVPRMEGPQSDRDVEMYRMAAGNLADPTIPAERKAAALATITEIARRQQATGNPAFTGIKLPGAAAPAASSGGWKIEKE
jgi:hypothetical protein